MDMDVYIYMYIYIYIYIYVVLWWLVTDSWLFRGSREKAHKGLGSILLEIFPTPCWVFFNMVGLNSEAMEADSWENDLHDLCDLYDLPSGYD